MNKLMKLWKHQEMRVQKIIDVDIACLTIGKCQFGEMSSMKLQKPPTPPPQTFPRENGGCILANATRTVEEIEMGRHPCPPIPIGTSCRVKLPPMHPRETGNVSNLNLILCCEEKGENVGWEQGRETKGIHQKLGGKNKNKKKGFERIEEFILN